MQRSRAKVDAPSGRDGEHFLIGQNPKFLNKTNFVRCLRRGSRPNKLACTFQCLGTSRKVGDAHFVSPPFLPMRRWDLEPSRT